MNLGELQATTLVLGSQTRPASYYTKAACPICDLVLTEDLVPMHIEHAHPPYREPWWLRALRWLAS